MNYTGTNRHMEFFESITIDGNPEMAANVARKAIVGHEVVHLRPQLRDTDPASLRAYYNRLVEAIGTPVDIAEDFSNAGAPTGERWSEIRYDPKIPDAAAFRYSKNAQPFHTDESYVSTSAGVMLFYCVSTAASGGETTFISGRTLVSILERDKPGFLEQLTTIPVRYQKAADFKDRPILTIKADGAVDLNYNFYCIAADQSAEQRRLNQDFFDYVETEFPKEHITSVALKPGEGLTWRDDLVLHGRNAFTASRNGDRWIWKTGIVLPAAA